MSNIDLHCHSTVSDGLLTPTQLVEHAAARGVTMLALTDHDDVGGLDEARRVAA
ncbi:MAG: PHP domain-containing protein, partial [Nitrosospira sp.]